MKRQRLVITIVSVASLACAAVAGVLYHRRHAALRADLDLATGTGDTSSLALAPMGGGTQVISAIERTWSEKRAVATTPTRKPSAPKVAQRTTVRRAVAPVRTPTRTVVRAPSPQPAPRTSVPEPQREPVRVVRRAPEPAESAPEPVIARAPAPSPEPDEAPAPAPLPRSTRRGSGVGTGGPIAYPTVPTAPDSRNGDRNNPWWKNGGSSGTVDAVVRRLPIP